MIADFFILIKSEEIKYTFYKTEPWTADTSHTTQAGKERSHLHTKDIYWKHASRSYTGKICVSVKCLLVQISG